MDIGVDRSDHVGSEQGNIQCAADQQAVLDQLGQAKLLSQLGRNGQRNNADGHRNHGSHSHQADGTQNIGIHVGAQRGANILHAADADTVDAKSEECPVLLENNQNVGDLGSLLCFRRRSKNSHTGR